MNYQKHYDILINKATTRILDKSTRIERHHIIPRSMGGSDVAIAVWIVALPFDIGAAATIVPSTYESIVSGRITAVSTAAVPVLYAARIFGR